MLHVTIDEATQDLSNLIQRAQAGEEVIITQDRLPVARLTPVPPRRERQFGSARGLIHMAPDFDAPLEDFMTVGEASASGY